MAGTRIAAESTDQPEPPPIECESVQVADEPWGLRPGTKLRRWQRDALEAWRQHQHIGIVQAVTGTGKTLVGVVAIAAALRAGMRCVVLVPTDQLVGQWTRTLHRLLPDAAVVQKSEDAPFWDVRVSTVQTAMSRNFLSKRESAMLVADECHRYGAASYSQALRRGYVWRLGLSATAERGDDGDEILRSYFRGICFDVSYRRATHDELIAPYDIALVGVPLEAGERASYDELSEGLSRQAMQLRDLAGVPAKPFAVFMATVSDLATDRTSCWQGLARSYLAKFAKRRDLLASTQMKRQALGIVAPVVSRSHGSLVFTQTKESAHDAALLLSQTGIWAGEVHSGQGTEEREERMYEFAAGATKALAAPRILDEGVDVPDANLGIVLASNRSRRQMIQRMGRVLRLKDDGGPARFVVMYAIDTVEDPHHLGQMPDFYRDCLPWARKWEEFDLRLSGESVRLLEFLGVEDEEPEWESARELLIGSPDTGTTHSDHGGDEEAGAAVEGPAPATLVTSQLPGDGARAHGDSPQPVGENDEPTTTVSLLREGAADWAAPAGDSTSFDEELLGEVFISDDIVHDYMRMIGWYPLLGGREDEVRLARRIECGIYASHLLEAGTWDGVATREELRLLADEGAEALEEMVTSNLRLVVSVVKNTFITGVDLIDKIQEGNCGLIRAVEKFDHTRGCKFSTYATWWIKQAVSRAADQGSTIRIPVHFAETINKARRWLRTRGIGLGDGASAFPDGIPELEISREQLIRISRLGRPLVSIDGLRDLLDDSIQMLPINGSAPVVPGDDYDPNLALAWSALDDLEFEGPRTCRILLMRWGVETGEEESLQTIGDLFRLSRERIRQLERAGVERVRQILVERSKGESLPENRPQFHLPASGDPRSSRHRRSSTKRNTKVSRSSHASAIPRNLLRVPEEWKSLGHQPR